MHNTDLSSEPVYCLVYSSILKMEVTCSYEKSVDFQRPTKRYIPEDIERFGKFG
jgi:hypothetical protein